MEIHFGIQWIVSKILSNFYYDLYQNSTYWLDIEFNWHSLGILLDFYSNSIEISIQRNTYLYTGTDQERPWCHKRRKHGLLETAETIDSCPSVLSRTLPRHTPELKIFFQQMIILHCNVFNLQIMLSLISLLLIKNDHY